MATNYIMGQYRYSGSKKENGDSECCGVIYDTYPEQLIGDNAPTPFYREISGSNDTNKMYYQDVIIPFYKGGTIDINDLFYINMSIAPDGVDDTVYSLKLINSKEWQDKMSEEAIKELNYETVATFIVPKTSILGAEAVGVSLYIPYGQDKDNGVPEIGRIKSDSNNLDDKGTLALNNDGTLVDGNGNTILYHNDIYLLPTWKTKVPEGVSYEYSSFVGSKYNGSNFDSLLLEIQRGEVDKSVATIVNEGKNQFTVIGRFLNVTDSDSNVFDVKISKIEKILPSIKNTTIKQIGVWGRSGLPLILNGEEIKIGPSGYFELKDFDLTSIGVLANGQEDKFTIDYLYESN